MIVSFLSACHYWLLRDLLFQLSKIKFENCHLQEINDQLQIKLEKINANLKNVSRKSLNLDKKRSPMNYLKLPETENEVQLLEYSDIEQCLTKEYDSSETMLCEKKMTENEISVSNDHIKSLSEKLATIETVLKEKNQIITCLKSMLANHQDLSLKLKEFTQESSGNGHEDEKNATAVVDALVQYEEKMNLFAETKFNIETLIANDDLRCDMDGLRSNDLHKSGENVVKDGVDDEMLTSDTKTHWPVKVQLSREVLDEDIFSEDDWLNTDESNESSFDKLKDQLKMLSSLRTTLVVYIEKLERASIDLKSTEHFSDEVTLSYISFLNNSISLVAASIKKTLRCQNYFNETFDCLWKNISNLKNENQSLKLQNEQLQIRLENLTDNNPIEIAEKLCFLEDQLRKERLSGSKRKKMIQDLERLRYERERCSKCYKCGRCSVGISVSSETNRQHLASEALNLERNAIRNRSSNTQLDKDAISLKIHTWLQSKRMTSQKSSTSIDEVPQSTQRTSSEQLKINESGLVIDDRECGILVDDQSTTPRHKLSSTQPSNLDIDDIIENSWLETNSTMDERRASVFAQSFDIPIITDTIDINIPSLHQPKAVRQKSLNSESKRFRNTSSSCSSSNDTSDTTSVDVKYERKKLAKELESRSLRLQARSPIPSGMSNESVTPTVNEDEQTKAWQSSVSYNEADFNTRDVNPCSPISAVDEYSATESVFMDVGPISRRSSINRQSVIFNPCDTTVMGTATPRHSLPTISIMEVMANDKNHAPTYPHSIESYIDCDQNQALPDELQSNAVNRSRFSSRASSIADGDSKYSRRSKKENPRSRRLYTVAGLCGIKSTKSVLEDNFNNCTVMPFIDNTSDIQISIDAYKDMKQLLVTIDSEDLESKFNEIGFIFSTDQQTLIERCYDANRRCNKAFANVDQEFNILRHLIKSVGQLADGSSDFSPRIRTSVNVLEKCVENLSTKSEQLGAVKEEMKMSSIIDVMTEYYKILVKQKSELLRELNEAKLLHESINDIVASGSFDVARLKRIINGGKDAKTRFQMLAQSTATKSSIVRQLTSNNSLKSSQISTMPDNLDWGASSQSDNKPQARRSGSLLAIDYQDSSMKSSELENAKIRKYAASKFFPGGNSVDENGENLFHKGLQQGMRASYDQTLVELKGEQTKMSVALESLNELIKDSVRLPGQDCQWKHMLSSRMAPLKEVVSKLWRHLQNMLKIIPVIVVGFMVVVAVIMPMLLTPSKTVSGKKSGRKIRSRSETKEILSSSSSSESLSPDYLPNITFKRRLP